LVHGLVPSDTNSFFFINEFKNRLIHFKSDEEKFLLEHYDIYIFPFINLDGVIFGNHSCNLTGNILTENPIVSKHTTPEIYYLLKELKIINAKQQIFVCTSIRSSLIR